MTPRSLSRRSFLGSAAALSLSGCHQLVAAERRKFKISDVRTMTLQGPSRTYLLVKVLADDGLYGALRKHMGYPGSVSKNRSCR
jgi:hypothetical protein